MRNSSFFYGDKNQTYFSSDGKIVDTEQLPDVIDMTPAEKDEKLSLIKAQSFDIKDFHNEFTNHTDEVMAMLLSMQSNENPLKKGGEGLAFRTDIFLSKNRQQFSNSGNDVLDVIFGVVSSNPQNESYYIAIRDIINILGIEKASDAYQIARKGVEELKSKPMEFDIPLNNGLTRKVAIPTYTLLTYIDTKSMDQDDKEVHISFMPSNFFRMLCISAGQTHGAYTNSKVSHRMTGYSRNFYYLLAEMKDYKEHPKAERGCFNLSIQFLKKQLGCSYSRATDYRRYILEPTKKMLEDLVDIGNDFIFDYKEIKEGRKITGFSFRITKVIDPERLSKVSEPQSIEAGYAEKELLTAFSFSKSDISAILKVYWEQNRDLAFLSQALSAMVGRDNIQNRPNYLISILKSGVISGNGVQNNNAFHNYEEHEYDYDSIEKAILNEPVK